MTWIKICGIQESDHINWVEQSGADAIGFVFTKSKRQVSPEQVRKMLSDKPTSLAKVGVFVNEDPSKMNEIARFCNLDFVQLHGEENEEIIKIIQRPVIKAIRVKNENDITTLSAYHQCYALLLDTYVTGERGGTGKSFDWQLAKKANAYGKIIIAGGLNPDNIAKAIHTSKCYGVDVSSGVETAGKKDHTKIIAFVKSAQAAIQT